MTMTAPRGDTSRGACVALSWRALPLIATMRLHTGDSSACVHVRLPVSLRRFTSVAGFMHTFVGVRQ